MEPAFWQQRWANNQIGFHQAQVNPYLQAFWPGLQLMPGSRVLVPLCGKSLDLAWLAGQGHEVMGVELSRQAVQAFFDEHGLQPQVRQHNGFEVWSSAGIELWCGDFFALQAQDVQGCAAFYDRAALIALPVAMRTGYLQALSALLRESCRGLVVTFDYDQSLLGGPPFSVGDDELRQGFAGWQVEVLEQAEVIEGNPKFQQAGVPSLLERVYKVSR